MACEEMYAIEETYLAPIKHDTLWSLYTNRLKDSLDWHNRVMELLQECIEAFQGPVAQNIITAKFDLDSSSRAMDEGVLSLQDDRIDRYEELGHYGIACVVQMHRMIAHPRLASAESSRLIRCRRLFLDEWVSFFNPFKSDDPSLSYLLKLRALDITKTQLFVPKGLCQLSSVLEDILRDGRKDYLGRSTHAITHDAGFRRLWPDAALAEEDVMSRSAAHMACCTNDSALLEQVILSGTWEKHRQRNYWPALPPLHYAAMRGFTDAFKMVQQKTSLDFLRIDLSEKALYTWRTCLHWAASCGHRDTVEFICQVMTTENATSTKDQWGRSALHLAALYGHYNVVRILCQHMELAAIDTLDECDRSALWYAAERNHVAVLSILERFSDLNQKDEYGDTPLAVACEKGHIDILQYLLKYCSSNIDLNAANKDDKTPLDLAIKGGHVACIELLMAHGALGSEFDSEQ